MGRIGDIVRNCDGLITRHAKGSDSLEDRVGISPYKVRELMAQHHVENTHEKLVKAANIPKPTFTCKTKQPKKPIRKKRVKFVKERKPCENKIDSTTFTCSRKILTERRAVDKHLNCIKEARFSDTLIAQGLDRLAIGGELLIRRFHQPSVCSYGYKVGKKFSTKQSEVVFGYIVATRIS